MSNANEEQLKEDCEGLIKALEKLGINPFIIEGLTENLTESSNTGGKKLNFKGERLLRLLKDVVHLASL